MKNIDDKVMKIIAALRWILVGLGALFTIWAFVLVLKSSSTPLEPIWIVFFKALS
jgi:hypothetical protein